MGLNIKNPETEAKIRELAALMGENLTTAVDRAVRFYSMELEKNEEESFEDRREKIDAILQSIRAMPVQDDRTPEEIIGYDEDGLPT